MLGIGKKINLKDGINSMNQILNKYKSGTIVEKLIYINFVAFVLTFLLNTLNFLFNSQSNLIVEWFSMPSNIDLFLLRPWSIISYGFLHGGFFHLVSNLIVLYFIGNLFIDYFTHKQLLSFYLSGTVFGGLLYLVSYAIFPALQGTSATLVGASAGVMAIFIGIATYIPNYEINFRFIGYVKLWKLAAFFIILDLIQIPSGNSGGHIAHIGGALFGFLYIQQVKKTSISFKNPFATFFNKRSTLKTVYKSKKKSTKKEQQSNQEKIDAILDKISKSGYESLSQEEKNLLFKQGKK